MLDATTGQNGISQATKFTEAVNCTGIVLAKLDGTAKGGVVVAIRQQVGLPVKYIGVGEKAEDLAPFSPEEFVRALFDEVTGEPRARHRFARAGRRNRRNLLRDRHSFKPKHVKIIAPELRSAHASKRRVPIDPSGTLSRCGAAARLSAARPAHITHQRFPRLFHDRLGPRSPRGQGETADPYSTCNGVPIMKRLWNYCAAFGAGLMWTSFALAAQPQLNAPLRRRPIIRIAAPWPRTSRPPTRRKTKPPPIRLRLRKRKKTTRPPARAVAAAILAARLRAAAKLLAALLRAARAKSAAALPAVAAAIVPSCIDNCWPFCCCCKPGDPWTLEKELTPCCNDVTYGGWFGAGYYTNNDPLSFRNNDRASFWDHPNELNLDQAWFWVEKKAKTRFVLLGLGLPR